MKQEIIRWKLMAHMLLGQHFGLTLNDTEFCDDCVVESLVADGTSPVDAINALVDKYDSLETHGPYAAGATLRINAQRYGVLR